MLQHDLHESVIIMGVEYGSVAIRNRFTPAHCKVAATASMVPNSNMIRESYAYIVMILMKARSRMRRLMLVIPFI